jgi:hypothetical protein
LRLRERAWKAAAMVPGFEGLTRLVRPREQVFLKAYQSDAWGSAESKSGEGSELAATENLRPYLPELFARYGVKRFLDAPCGDWNWMSKVDLSAVEYVGADVVADVVERNTQAFARPGVRFVHADLTKDDLPPVDLILSRDCWVHLSFHDIGAMLKNFRRTGATWLLVSNSPKQDRNVAKSTSLTWRHLNLQKPPFSFPAPLEARKDHHPDTPIEITLWRLADLPDVAN